MPRGPSPDVDDEALEIRDEMTANDVEGWDSLTHVDLIVAVEKRFRVEVTTRDVAALKTVGHLVRLLEERTAAC